MQAETDANGKAVAALHSAVQQLNKPAPVAIAHPDESKPAATLPAHIDATFEAVAGGLNIRFPWGRQVAAAVFIRNDVLWVIFDTPVTMRHSELDAKVGLRLKSVTQVPNAAATILQYRIQPGQWAGVELDDNNWIVSLKDTEILPRSILSTEVGVDGIAGNTVSIAVASPSNIVALADQKVGDTILVTPLRSMANGFSEPAKLRGGELLKTAQGIAFVPLSSRYVLVRQDNSVLVTDAAASSSAGQASGFVRSSVGTSTARLVDLEAWSLKDGRTVDEIEGDLLYDLSMAKPMDQQAIRWKLATFYLARGLYQRARGVIDIMKRKDAGVEALPQYRAVRGIVALMVRDYAASREDLLDLSLDGVNEIWLWRARLHMAEMRAQAAVEAFKRGSDVLSYYDAVESAEFQLAAIRAAMIVGDGALAQRELDLIDKLEISPAQKSEAAYWRGRLVALQGHGSEALKIFESIHKEPNRRAYGMAQLSATQVQVDTAALKLTPAINRLEQLRFAWRGDAFEIELLDTLANYYKKSKRYRDALVAYRQQVSYFKPDDRTRAAMIAQDSLFRELFLNGTADTMPPIQALALFSDFRKLTPLGTDGDLMIRRLSERLVDVGLFARAAELLEHQVRYRLEGTAQAIVASRLAMVQILAGKPQAALDVLRYTRSISTSDDVRAARNRIEARALIDLQDFEAAEVIISDDDSPIGRVLRADLAWRRKDWKELIVATNAVLQAGGNGLASESADRRKHVLRLIFAQNMLNNGEALRSIKSQYQGIMTGNEYEQAFNLLASGATLGPAEIRSLSQTLVSLDKLDSFADIYRAELRAMDIPVSDTPDLTPQQAAALTPAAGTSRRD